MSERDPTRIDESKGTATQDEPTGAKAAAEGAGNPDIPSVGNRAESHHIAHAESKAGEREDEDNVEDSRAGEPDAAHIDPVSDEANPPGTRHVA